MISSKGTCGPEYLLVCPLLRTRLARRRGDAAEFVNRVEQGNESVVFRFSAFLALPDD
jgi:hypothetical protein